MNWEEMKKEIPETPEFIHTMIQSEVKKQLQNTNVISIRKKKVKKWTGAKVAAAAIACVLSVSSIAYAGVKLYHMFLEKQGIYSIVTGIKADDGTGELMLPEKIHDIDITAEYIPEGMAWIDKWHLEYPEHARTGGFSFSSVLLDEDDLSKAMQDKHVVDCEERTFGDYEGVYLKYHGLSEGGFFNQRIYLLCPDLYRVITVYIGDDVTKEDAVKVAENLVITENDTVMETAGLGTWSEMVSPEESSDETMPTSVESSKLPVYQIGEPLEISAFAEDSDGNYLENQNISICVDSVQVEDNLQLLEPDRIPKEWLTAVGPDGKITENTLSYIKYGDGINSLDEIVKTESMKQKLVYVTVTYTNETDKEMYHLLYASALMLIDQKDGKYQIYDPAAQSGDGYDGVMWNGVAHTGNMTYSSVFEDYGNGGNYIASLKPGESIQVNMAWIVNESDLNHMYLNLNCDAGGFDFSDSTLKAGVVDISRHANNEN